MTRCWSRRWAGISAASTRGDAEGLEALHRARLRLGDPRVPGGAVIEPASAAAASATAAAARARRVKVPIRVRRIVLHSVELPLVSSFRTAYGTTTGKRSILVRLEDAEGVVGWGEASGAE